MAGHHQSNNVAKAVLAMIAASQAGRSRDGAARWMVTSVRTVDFEQFESDRPRCR